MTADISLTASMRSNLLSLQQISTLQDRTQLRLSTGLKVNSAIDNPSSYYTASALNNRADDLSALLDSMGQGVQTIKAATEGIEKAEDLITQMKAIAEQVQTKPLEELDKSWYVEQAAKMNGVVVSNAEELKAALLEPQATAPEVIVIYGKIDINLDDADFNRSIELKDNQKLVGTEYFANIDQNALYRGKDNNRISELNIYSNTDGRTGITADVATSSTISDLTINYENTGKKNIYAIFFNGVNAKHNISNIDVNIINIDTAYINMFFRVTSAEVTGTINLNGGDRVFYNHASQVNVDGNLNFLSTTGSYLWSQSGGNISISSNSTIKVPDRLHITRTDGTMDIANGAKIGLVNQDMYYEVQDLSITQSININKDYIEKNPNNFKATEKWETEEDHSKIRILEENYLSKMLSLNNTLSQYDMLINDSSYKGVNLLQADDLKVIFNENRSATLNVKGVDLSSDKIGLLTADWLTAEDVQKTLDVLTDAKDKLRSAATKLGNYYSIITERQTFTENLINVLTEGADKLTLADMNEESANMLALQTQQQLAVNSLSLASQASQAVLRLF